MLSTKCALRFIKKINSERINIHMKKFKNFFATIITSLLSFSLQAAVEIDEALHEACQSLPEASIPLGELGNKQPGFPELQQKIQDSLPAVFPTKKEEIKALMTKIGETFDWQFDESTGIGGHFIFNTKEKFLVNAFMIPLGKAIKSEHIKGMRYTTTYRTESGVEQTYDVNFTTTKKPTDKLTSHLQVKIENGIVRNVKSYVSSPEGQFSRPLGRELAAPVGEAISFMGQKIKNQEITSETLVMVRYVIEDISEKSCE